MKNSRMTDKVLEFLGQMSAEIISIVGVSCIPIILLISYRAAGLCDLNSENYAEKLGDLCYDTIKEKIKDRVDELLLEYSNYNGLPMPCDERIQDAINNLHQDCESLERLLPILKNLNELGIQSEEFLTILIYLF